jgi:hypothetical protein
MAAENSNATNEAHIRGIIEARVKAGGDKNNNALLSSHAPIVSGGSMFRCPLGEKRGWDRKRDILYFLGRPRGLRLAFKPS